VPSSKRADASRSAKRVELVKKLGLYDEDASRKYGGHRADCPRCREQMILEKNGWRCYGQCSDAWTIDRLLVARAA